MSPENLDEYRAAWRAAEPPAAARREVEELIDGIARSQRRASAVLWICSVNTGLMTLLSAWILWSRRVPAGLDLAVVLVVQAVLTLALAVIVRRHRARRRALRQSVSSVRESAEIGLRAVNSELRDTKVLAGVAVVFVAWFAIAMSRLYASGKMDAAAVTALSVICALVIGINAVIAWRRRTRLLLPRRRRLELIERAMREAV